MTVSSAYDGISGVVAGAETKECFFYSSGFFRSSEEALAANDSEGASNYRLLGFVTGMALQSDNAATPFQPMMRTEKGRTAIPTDLSRDEIDTLRRLFPEITDPELKARIGDLLWVIDRDYKMAELAIDAYLESAIVLEDVDSWVLCSKRIERAFRLAIQLGPSAGHFDRVVQHIVKTVRKYNGDDPLYLTEKLLALLCERGVDHPKDYSVLAEKVATIAEHGGDWRRARTYWDRKAVLDRIRGDDAAMREAGRRSAETYVRLAESSLSGPKPSFLAASHHLQQGVEAFRRLGLRERADEVHKQLLECQAHLVEEMAPISTEIDLTKITETSRASVAGKSFNDALAILSMQVTIERKEVVRKRVEEVARLAPLTHLIGGKKVNQKGKTIGIKPGLLTSTPEDYEVALSSHMYEEIRLGCYIDAVGVIVPILKQINYEHPCLIDAFNDIVANNPLVPEDRTTIYEKGLHAGLVGNMLEAISLLVPQFENSVRYLMEQRGVPTSSMDDDGIQQEYDLNKTLRMPEVVEIFGEDLTFTMRALLVEKDGANIRNRMAHGLMSYAEFNQPECYYLWGLILRLCCWPLISNKVAEMAVGGGEPELDQAGPLNEEQGKADTASSVEPG